MTHLQKILAICSLFACAACEQHPPAANGTADPKVTKIDEAAANSPNPKKEEAAMAQEPSEATTTSVAENSKGPVLKAQRGESVLHPRLAQYVESLLPEMANIPDERKDALKKLALFVRTKLASNEPASLTFICTHNSRRSHLGQLWAAAAAAYYRIDGVETFSGGTEATAFNPRAVAAIERAGFSVQKPEGANPHYQVSFGDKAEAQECFSKKYDDPFNPKDNFAAVMTCSEADKNCPTVQGATLRVPLPYVDPKVSDGTDAETTTYDERSKQIATEMFYLFSQVGADAQ